ncbi:MAG: ATP-binding protein [Deltaproteobacteria bacterium]
MRFRAPANVLLRRAQLTLMLATLVPTVLMTALGIVMLAVGQGTANVVIGVLFLAFCTTSLTGYILGSIFVSRGASLARVQNDFVSSVSHELRTPLTSIRMFIETLRDERLTDPVEREKCLGLLQREVERLDGLVSRVIELSRIESRGKAFQKDPLRLLDVVKDAIAAFDAATLSDPVEVGLDVDERLHVTGDRDTLALAVTNLLLNAHKYTSSGDREISIAVEAATKTEVEIRVKDNGSGIPRAEQKLIFEQFERGQQAIDTRTTGSGLGLAIVKAIVSAHRGRIEVRSKEGEGAEFCIRLKRRVLPA